MSFTTPHGTRGGRMASGRFPALMNRLMARRAGRRGRLMGMQVLALTTVGRRSGQRRTTPVAWFPWTDGSYLVVASAGGARRNPGWYHNIVAHPDQVEVEVQGHSTAVDPEELHGEERARAWELITRTLPRFAGYEEKTDREMPVIRLRPRSG